MIVKCNKTGKILFSTDEATKHAEEIGSQDFTEIAPDAVLVVDAETKRRVFHGGMEEVGRFCLACLREVVLLCVRRKVDSASLG